MKTLPKHEEQTRASYRNEHVLNGEWHPTLLSSYSSSTSVFTKSEEIWVQV